MRNERRRRNIEKDFRFGAPVRKHPKAPIGFLVFASDDAFGDFALKHQHHGVVPRRPGFDAQPVDQKRSCDVVRQVRDDLRACGAEQGARFELRRVRVDDLKAARIAVRDFLEGTDGAFVALDGNDSFCPHREQRAGQSAGAGANLDDDSILERPGSARDPCSEIQIEQEVLPQRFARGERMTLDDVTQRRQVVDCAHADGIASRAARRNAAIRLDGSARPVPAISNAVP